MMLKKLALAGAISLMGTSAFAACSYENSTELKMLSAGFGAWKAVTDSMAECGNFQAELDQEVVSAKEALRKQVSSVAVAGAEKILKREVDAKAHANILDELIAKI